MEGVMGISNGLTYNSFWFIIGRIFLMLIIILLNIYIYIYRMYVVCIRCYKVLKWEEGGNVCLYGWRSLSSFVLYIGWFSFSEVI